jgi:hypothetical protein
MNQIEAVEMLADALERVMQGDSMPAAAQEFLDARKRRRHAVLECWDALREAPHGLVLPPELVAAAIRFFKYHSGG